MRRGRRPHPDVLTPRQWQVLALMREGKSNPQIAESLGISLDGVKYHVSEILSRLGLSSREEAAAWRSNEEHRAALGPLILAFRKVSPGRLAVAGVVAMTAAGLLFLAIGLLVVKSPGGASTVGAAEEPAVTVSEGSEGGFLFGGSGFAPFSAVSLSGSPSTPRADGFGGFSMGDVVRTDASGSFEVSLDLVKCLGAGSFSLWFDGSQGVANLTVDVP